MRREFRKSLLDSATVFAYKQNFFLCTWHYDATASLDKNIKIKNRDKKINESCLFPDKYSTNK